MARRTLVTGGVRSGKSAYAEALLADEPAVTYVAPGPAPGPDDPDWAERVAAHQRRRPAHWTTVETTDAAAALRSLDGTAVLLDCLGTWVTAVLDELAAWEAPKSAWRSAVDDRVAALAAAWSAAPGVAVAVTNEAGMGVVPAHRSGRVFRDALGVVNQRIAEVSDDVALVVAGRVLHL